MIEKAYGSKLRGKLHKKNHMPNQDNYLVYNSKSFTLAVVCDGMGSKKYSHIGSRRLCKIIKKQVKIALSSGKFNAIELLVKIQACWLSKLFPFSLKNCDTTCLFCIISENNILFCQLGDGIIAIKTNEDVEIIKTKEDDFSNETKGIGKSKINDWAIKIIKKEINIKYEILLGTDGVSEDLKLEMLSEFISTINSNVSGKYSKNKYLNNILRNWPNRFSNDDKTIVVVK